MYEQQTSPIGIDSSGSEWNRSQTTNSPVSVVCRVGSSNGLRVSLGTASLGILRIAVLGGGTFPMAVSNTAPSKKFRGKCDQSISMMTMPAYWCKKLVPCSTPRWEIDDSYHRDYNPSIIECNMVEIVIFKIGIERRKVDLEHIPL